VPTVIVFVTNTIPAKTSNPIVSQMNLFQMIQSLDTTLYQEKLIKFAKRIRVVLMVATKYIRTHYFFSVTSKLVELKKVLDALVAT